MYCNSQNRMRMRMYHCFTDIKLHQRFAPMVSGPDRLSDMKPHVVRASHHPGVGPCCWSCHSVPTTARSLPLSLSEILVPSYYTLRHRCMCVGDRGTLRVVSYHNTAYDRLCRRTGACFTIRSATATSDRPRRPARRNHWDRSSPARGLRGVRAEGLRRPKRLRRLPLAAPMPSSLASHHRVSDLHQSWRWY